MRAEEYGLARLPRPQQKLAHADAPQRIERGCGLVEDEQFRIVHQRLRQTYALQHAAGKLAGVATGDLRQFKFVEHFCCPLPKQRIFHAVQRAVESDQLGRRAMVESDVLRQKADAATGGRVSKFVSQHCAMPAAGKHQANRQVHGRGLACAVGPEKAEDLAGFHAQREITQRGDPLAPEKAAVLLADVVKLQGRKIGHA